MFDGGIKVAPRQVVLGEIRTVIEVVEMTKGRESGNKEIMRDAGREVRF